jgi:hypothetical protein
VPSFSDDERLFKGMPLAHVYKIGDRYRLSSAAFKQGFDKASNRYVSSCFRELFMTLDEFVSYQSAKGRDGWGITDSTCGRVMSAGQSSPPSHCELVQERTPGDDHEAHCHIYVARNKAALDRLRSVFEPVRPPAGMESAIWSHDI